jgi:pyruvate/2-oxoglutarate/acetoin dehydrogenase E1 component
MREISYMEALREGMRQAMQQDERVFVIGKTSAYTAALSALRPA